MLPRCRHGRWCARDSLVKTPPFPTHARNSTPFWIERSPDHRTQLILRHSRARLEHSDERLNGNYKGRRNAVAACAAVAWNKGFPGFVIQVTIKQ